MGMFDDLIEQHAPTKPAGGGMFDDLVAQHQTEALPDVGAPAITAGQEEFSPGLPAVNHAADVLAQSANKNLIEPITHPIETAKGIGSLGLGLAQYAGFPGEEFKPSVDALAADYKKTYGSLAGFKDALSNDPVRVAMDASMGLGLLGKLGRAGGIGRTAARVEAPSIEALHDSAEGHYNAMHGFGVEVHPHVMDDVATNMTTALKTQGFYPKIAPKTFDMIDELRNPDGPTFTTQQIDSIRKGLGKITADPADKAAARQVIEAIDSTMEGLTPADAAVNGHFAPRVAQEAVQARGDYAAAKRAEAVDTARNKAELQAASTGSGGNIDNATRQRFRTVLNSPKLRRGFSADEIAEMERIVRGTSLGNAARLAGKLAPTGIVSAGLSAALGHAVGHSIGVPSLGLAAKAAADAITGGGVRRLSENVRLRSPEAQRIGATATPPRMPRIARAGIRNTQRAGLLGRLSNPYEEQQ
jgi:hypothetical protein